MNVKVVRELLFLQSVGVHLYFNSKKKCSVHLIKDTTVFLYYTVAAIFMWCEKPKRQIKTNDKILLVTDWFLKQYSLIFSNKLHCSHRWHGNPATSPATSKYSFFSYVSFNFQSNISFSLADCCLYFLNISALVNFVDSFVLNIREKQPSSKSIVDNSMYRACQSAIQRN